MSIRVISGQFGSRVLKTVRGPGTRPLLSQVRESLFDVLGDRVGGRLVWDLFAGTGATGIEALSRGARRVVFVEKANRALAVLQENLDLLGGDARERSSVVRGDAWDPRGIEGRSEFEDSPDLVFLDPPYAMVAEDPVRAVYRSRKIASFMAPGGILCFHFQDGILQEDDFDAELDVDIRLWGNSGIAFLELAGGSVDPDPPPTARSCSAPG